MLATCHPPILSKHEDSELGSKRTGNKNKPKTTKSIDEEKNILCMHSIFDLVRN